MSRANALQLPLPQLRLPFPDVGEADPITSLTTAERDELVRLLANLLLEAAGLVEEVGHDREQ